MSNSVIPGSVPTGSVPASAAQTQPVQSSSTRPVIAAIDHVVIRVRELEQTAQFYSEVLGCLIDRRRDNLGMIHLRAGSALIDLVSVDGPLGQSGRAPEPEARNLDHLCLQIANLSIEQIQQHLLSQGVPFGEIKRRYGATGEGDSIYLHDNEGNGIELKSVARAA